MAQGRKLTSLPLQNRQGLRRSTARVETVLFKGHLLNTYYVRGTLWDVLHFIVFDVCFLRSFSQHIYLLGHDKGHALIKMDEETDSQRNYVSRPKSKDSEVQTQGFWLQTHVFPVPPRRSLSALDLLSVETDTSAFRPFQLAVPIKAPYSG